MRIQNWFGLITAVAILSLTAWGGLPVSAQQKIDINGDAPDHSKSAEGVQIETMAVLPWDFEKGSSGAVKTGNEFLASVLSKSHVETLSEPRTLAGWEEANSIAWSEDKKDLPSPAQMLRAGNKLGVDWVMAGRAVWHTKSVWIGLGPKTKSDCTVDVRIVDVKNREVVLDAKQVRLDDTAKEDTMKALGAVFVSGLFTMVSGGPKTPHEQRAVQLAMGKAMEPWLVQHMKIAKINPESK
jgi:hypothetical protein